MTDVITKILGEGAGVGLHLVMTGDRSLVAGRIAAMCEEKLAFKLADKDDYGMIGLRAKDMPDEVPPGRCFRAGSGIEVQVALLDPDASGQGQAAALRSIAALAGVGGDDLTAYGPDLADGVPAFIIGGPAKSGRSTILVSMARSLLAAGTPVILAAPRPSPLRALSGAPGVLRLFDGHDIDQEELTAALSSAGERCVVIIDDAEMLNDCDAAGELKGIVQHGADSGRALVFAGDADSICPGFGGWQVEAKRARRGCLTAPQGLAEGQLIGATLTHAMTGASAKPGRTLIHLGDGTVFTVAVPVD
jgi:S-DNA-T family DNA segregation ATPase FtsK/SpoIIIE